MGYQNGKQKHQTTTYNIMVAMLCIIFFNFWFSVGQFLFIGKFCLSIEVARNRHRYPLGTKTSNTKITL